MYDLSQALYVEQQSPVLLIHNSPLGLAHRAFAEKATQGLQPWFRPGRTLSLVTGSTPDPQTSVQLQAGSPGPWDVSDRGCVRGQGRWVLLSATSVDVFPVHSVLHKGNVVIGGQCEVRDAAHEALHVLSVRVQSDFLHPTCRGPRWRRE